MRLTVDDAIEHRQHHFTKISTNPVGYRLWTNPSRALVSFPKQSQFQAFQLFGLARVGILLLRSPDYIFWTNNS